MAAIVQRSTVTVMTTIPRPRLHDDVAQAREYRTATSAKDRPVLDVTIPVYNEEATLAACVRRLHDYLSEHVPYTFRITIADNASTDSTGWIAGALAGDLPDVAVVRLDRKGRGGALREVWSTSNAQVLAYMDVDLSTDLSGLLPLIAPLMSGHSDIAIGTRLARGARVVRGPKREFISRGYNLLLRGALGTRFTDAQCGFKAIRAEVARSLLPLVQDTAWFFDTELLVLAQRAGLRIHEVPVDWVDDSDSKVDIMSTAWADVRGIARLGWALARRRLPLDEVRERLGRGSLDPASKSDFLEHVIRFSLIGIASTIAYLLLFSLLHGLGPQPANFIALAVTAIANTAANRRFTFAVSGRRRLARHHVEGLLVFGLGLALTSGSLSLLYGTTVDPSHTTELVVLVLANFAATILRFLLLRSWVFHPRRR
ncbi:MAG: bifunctional glycosyltransferase family 2/GtrA family protein [Corynebacteriales bacterium]|nr:bifunctional glycosyltransferase family 2/GtrA family protein [Mycobacteriales bacterium]